MCSIVDSQCENLRAAAQAYRNFGVYKMEQMLLDAADTISELREDLQRVNAENDRLRVECDEWKRVAESKQDIIDHMRDANHENAKLRELARRYGEYTNQDRCEGCVLKSRCNDGEVDECWQLAEIRKIARELGMELDA